MEELKKFYCGDCLELLPQKVKSKSVRLICTDPQFCVGVTSNGQKANWTDNYIIRPFFRNLFKEWIRVLKDGGEYYLNTDWRTYPLVYPILYQSGLIIRNVIVWNHQWMKAGNYYRFSHELIVYGHKGNCKRSFPGNKRDIWEIKGVNPFKPRHHKAEKPIALTDEIILNSSKEGDTVLDCFVGSGSTAISAINNKRNFIGFEINEIEYLKAMKRIKNETGLLT